MKPHGKYVIYGISLFVLSFILLLWTYHRSTGGFPVSADNDPTETCYIIGQAICNTAHGFSFGDLLADSFYFLTITSFLGAWLGLKDKNIPASLVAILVWFSIINITTLTLKIPVLFRSPWHGIGISYSYLPFSALPIYLVAFVIGNFLGNQLRKKTLNREHL